MTTKRICEGRFGPPKTFKTGAVVGTYPKPMLVFETDQGGMDIIPATNNGTRTDFIKLDVTQKDITYITDVAAFKVLQEKPQAELPPITCYNLVDSRIQLITNDYRPQANSTTFPKITDAINALLSGKCPWKTVVLDNTTSLSDAIYGHVAHVNMAAMGDPRKWAPFVGGKIKSIIVECIKLPCHFVVIMHEKTDKNEVTGEIKTEPMIYSDYRQVVGGAVSSFFYQTKVNGKPVIKTNDMGFIKGLGLRWPELPDECGVTFKDIYGKSVESGEVVI